MARSHAVWLVVKNDKPVRAFTVKHEAQSWLERELGERYWSIYRVFRLPDGARGSDAEELHLREFVFGNH